MPLPRFPYRPFKASPVLRKQPLVGFVECKLRCSGNFKKQQQTAKKLGKMTPSSPSQNLSRF